ncbi:MAG TPA: sigma-54-dependent Fis family transcriptional regulator [Myxococcota bacterium]|nr:sigma-54-dependent Fis family transcriptional regulator [Myxococcota bacterium]
MSDTLLEAELLQVRRERDLYRAVLELGAHDDPDRLLDEALGLVIAATGAVQGYIELRDESAGASEGWWIARACTPREIDEIRANISRGIIAKALATGETIVTHSAFLDERFSHLDSVRARGIEAVICAPIGGDAGLGVVYLQRGAAPGAFSEEHRRYAEILARHLAPLADRLLAHRRADASSDATTKLRERYRLDGFVGRSAAIAEAIRQAMLAAPLDVNVLLTGPSGTGKSQLARIIHDNSPRATGPFVELNCAAIPEALLESELFGALARSHSTATRNTPGKVAAAQGGTLVLDEVGELPMVAQAKLLQLLHSKQYYPLGAATPTRADVRLVAATNVHLEEAVRERRFREDLFYRLQVLPIRLAPLAERKDDIPPLVTHLANVVCNRHDLPRLAVSGFALLAIRTADWPGNVRQLEHTLEAAAIRAAAERAERIELHHVFPTASRRTESSGPPTFHEATLAFQRELVEKTLQDTGWNIAETARRLDLVRSHVYNLIRSLALEKKGGSADRDRSRSLFPGS